MVTAFDTDHCPFRNGVPKFVYCTQRTVASKHRQAPDALYYDYPLHAPPPRGGGTDKQKTFLQYTHTGLDGSR